MKVNNKMKAGSEEYCQIFVVSFLKKLQIMHPVFEFWATPNGGQRSASSASMMKLTGTLPGVYDMIIIGQNKNIVFVENKLTKGKISDAQKQFKRKLDQFGFKNYTVFADTPHEMVEKYGQIMMNDFSIDQNSVSQSSHASLASVAKFSGK
jgi:hypothetical protein